mmetsp:Transcript_10929/g.18144  ORF Transcript_10929/g.18144 Transcript_10929/m.18144 type:complete len:423 (-) Transcript_10929:33-1301(-)
MANKVKKKTRSKKRATHQRLASEDDLDECKYYANLGCHIANVARCRVEATRKHPWLLGIEPFDPNDYDPDDIEHIPEVAMNDGEEDEYGDCEMSLTLTNIKKSTSILFVTVYDVDLCGADGKILTSGWTYTTTANNATTQRKCTTFIVLCPPQTFVHLVTLVPNQTIASDTERMPITTWSQIEIESDVQQWSFHPNVKDEHPHLLHFPFYGNKEEVVHEDEATKSYQCSQSENGNLTHFFHGNYHAIDFRCPIGTPLYSATNGVVVEVKDDGGGGHKKNVPTTSNEDRDQIIEVSGIAASNLFHWNSIMIQSTDADTSDPLYIEYVHIQTNSCAVKVGDSVTRGQFICRSGSVGFSPEPHLHMAAYRSNDVDAATVRVRFQAIYNHDTRDSELNAADAQSFLPRVGQWYNQNGLVEATLEDK